ncbi:MAG TPA: hypothetical protein VJP41_08370 [Gaiellaceae bacterium]|nr:hypothetical protein [Gaiellaceae bacterium]
MTDDHLQGRADSLAARVAALADALRSGGVPEEASAQLLSHASAAVLQALNLELLTAERRRATGKPTQRPLLSRASYCLVFGASDEPSRTLVAARAAA